MINAPMERFSTRFSRVEARRRARSHVAGLLGTVERKTGGLFSKQEFNVRMPPADGSRFRSPVQRLLPEPRERIS
ncbi:hypothetical protein [Azospirillum doebereinerae]